MQNKTPFKFRCNIKPATKKALKAHCGLSGETIKSVVHKVMQAYAGKPYKVDTVKYMTGSKDVADLMAIIDGELYARFWRACKKQQVAGSTAIEKGLQDYLGLGK